MAGFPCLPLSATSPCSSAIWNEEILTKRFEYEKILKAADEKESENLLHELRQKLAAGALRRTSGLKILLMMSKPDSAKPDWGGKK